MLKYILTGSGRCGTGFIANLLNSAGITCGHELFFTPHGYSQEFMRHYWTGTIADSSWLAAPFLDDFLDPIKIQIIRHPQKVIASLLKIGFFSAAPNPNTRPYIKFAYDHLPELADYRNEIDRAAYFWLAWNLKIQDKVQYVHRIEDEPEELLDWLDVDCSNKDLFNDTEFNTKIKGPGPIVNLDAISLPLQIRLLEMSTRYGYEWETIEVPRPQPKVIKAIITTLDNLPLLKQQISVLRDEPIDEIIVVNNGSVDNTRGWLAEPEQSDLTAINRENKGAGPGRNAGLNKAGKFDYVLMLDGGIRPLIGGTKKMLDYLESTPAADVIGVEIPDFRTDEKKAWRRWAYDIKWTYQNTRLSHTAYCLARAKAWDGLRFSEDGPFAEPGWGADDDEMAYRWRDAGITVHVVTCRCNLGEPCTGVHPYRRGSGSFNRLYKETGIWPNQYGSVYEKRVVWLQQNWAKHQPVLQWGQPKDDRIIHIHHNGDLETTILSIKDTHNELRQDRFDAPYQGAWHPYHIIVHCKADDTEFLKWAEPRRLRHHHGDTIILDEYGPEPKIIKKGNGNRDLWTGDFILDIER